jgi:hypothetical protein
MIFTALLSNGSALAQTGPADLKDQVAVVRYAERASLRALNFVQGDITSLLDAKDDFSEFGGVSTTIYRAEIDVRLGGKPVKIKRLEQRACAGPKSMGSCR